MTNCVICHKQLCENRLETMSEIITNDFVCICFECIKKQNKN